MTILLTSILPFAGILLGLVVIHEAGHFITAKIFGVRVLEAGIGLPPRVAGFTWRGTDYTLNLLPLGAFVRLLGEEDPNDPERKALGEHVQLPDSLAAQPKWKRTIIIGAGAVINLIAAVVLFSVGLMIPHPVSVGGAKIGFVAPDSPAATAKLQEGDEFPSRMLQAQVPRGAHAQIGAARMAKQPDLAWPAGRVAAGDPGAAVLRAVVHEQQLDLRMGLGEHTVDRLGQEALSIEEDDDRADQARDRRPIAAMGRVHDRGGFTPQRQAPRRTAARTGREMHSRRRP